MSRVRMMYWKEIPLQVQGEDDTGKVSMQLDDRFQEGVDSVSMFDGSAGNDDYLEGFQWGSYVQMDGSPEKVASTLVSKFNQKFPKDFVTRIRDLHRSGKREPSPGAVDGWLDE